MFDCWWMHRYTLSRRIVLPEASCSPGTATPLHALRKGESGLLQDNSQTKSCLDMAGTWLSPLDMRRIALSGRGVASDVYLLICISETRVNLDLFEEHLSLSSDDLRQNMPNTRRDLRVLGNSHGDAPVARLP